MDNPMDLRNIFRIVLRVVGAIRWIALNYLVWFYLDSVRAIRWIAPTRMFDNNAVQMVGHDYKCIQFNLRADQRSAQPFTIGDFTGRG